LKGTDSCNNTLFEKLNIKVVPKLWPVSVKKNGCICP